MTPADLEWANMPTLSPGVMVAVIEGPLDPPVAFIRRLRLPANCHMPANGHPWIQHVTVI